MVKYHIAIKMKAFHKEARYKINTQKSMAFLEVNNPKKEIKKLILFTVPLRIIKYLGINQRGEKFVQ